jgi:glycosyltransferase involved in cell wall biosynthesis
MSALWLNAKLTVASLLPPEVVIGVQRFKHAFLRRFFVSTTRECKDVLFVNGCSLDHPQRYRVDHQIEQLQFNGLTCDKLYFEKLSPADLKFYRGFVFFRCPITPVIGELISKARYFNKTVLFDIDDLVLAEEYVRDLPYFKTASKKESDLYMDGVRRMRATFDQCQFAITTTEALARELGRLGKHVLVNRNVASEAMEKLSQIALEAKQSRQEIAENQQVRRVKIGYLSGSITHNADLGLIAPALREILEKHPKVDLRLIGLIDVPKELKVFGPRVEVRAMVKWQDLPEVIADLDINLAPLESNLFNEAKSENKWTEAALVQTVTVASRLGAFKEVIRHEETGLLCDTPQDWVEALTRLVTDAGLRASLAQQAYRQAITGHTTMATGPALARYMRERLPKSVGFVAPGTKVSGGVNVIVKHANILRKKGYDVTFLSMDRSDASLHSNDGELNVLSIPYKHQLNASFDILVASLWSTVDLVHKYPMVRKRMYLVQGYETDFHQTGHMFRSRTQATYNYSSYFDYLTVSKWCQQWLHDKFGVTAKYAPNGISLQQFHFVERDFTGKIRVLIEGDSLTPAKGVDESFRIANRLDRARFEVWYMSYENAPKPWYQVDRFLHRVPHAEVASVYQSCHVLLKSSVLESFSYPPLEMMATGGIAVVVPNDGNREYLKDGENCLMYESGNEDLGLEQVHRVVNDPTLREAIIANGLKTARSRDWSALEEDIFRVYTSPSPAR